MNMHIAYLQSHGYEDGYVVVAAATKAIFFKSANQIRFPVISQSPYWQKPQFGLALFLKILGGHHKRLAGPMAPVNTLLRTPST